MLIEHWRASRECHPMSVSLSIRAEKTRHEGRDFVGRRIQSKMARVEYVNVRRWHIAAIGLGLRNCE
jgi:hypothetical protein